MNIGVLAPHRIKELAFFSKKTCNNSSASERSWAWALPKDSSTSGSVEVNIFHLFLHGLHGLLLTCRSALVCVSLPLLSRALSHVM